MNSNLPVLYSFRRCPYAMRARMALRYAGVRVELREVVLKDKPLELLELSPKGTVPVLSVEDNVLEESLDIMLWALAKRDPEGWLDRLDEARALIDMNDLTFKAHLDGYKYASPGGEATKLAHRDAAEQMLAELDTHLVGRPFLQGESRGLADVALLPFVRQFANVDISWFEALPYVQLKNWLRRLLDEALFAEIMGKFPPWQKGDPITVI